MDAGLDALRNDRMFDFVVDTSAYIPRCARASAEFLADRVGAYALVSTVSVYPELGTLGIDENTPIGRLTEVDPDKTDKIDKVDNENYGPLKALCEEAAEAALPGRTFDVRPGLIVGPRDETDRFTYWPQRVQQSEEVVAPGRPRPQSTARRRLGLVCSKT